ncbi:DMT family transporter [Gordonia humi]|uniref:Transporter family-2 protein n=1 Tax=Gordonia humi TaxID=686429 RepID=A0A840EPY1_9ACTN|nr:DMT family transporter [Gordonia humi]MBB4133551.1 transporter family-2 protein [Gordonia humi]
MARVWLLAMTVATGVLLSLQARINTFLAHDLGSGLGAGALVFFFGLLTTLVVTSVVPAARRSVRSSWDMLRRRELPRYLLLGGPIGIIVIQAQIAEVPVVGVALFAMSFIVGQMMSGAVIDYFGWSVGVRRRLSAVGAVSLLFALAGVTVSSLPGLKTSGSGVWLACAVAFIAGGAVGVQMAFNGAITAAVGRPEAAGVATYVFGTLMYVALIAVTSAVDDGATLASYTHVRWWYCALGVIGPTVVLAGAALVRRIGVLLFAVGVVAGQLAGSLVLDAVWPAAAGTLSWLTLLGAVMAGVALVCLQRWGQRTVVDESDPSISGSVVSCER